MDMGKNKRVDGQKAFSQWVVQQILPMFSYNVLMVINLITYHITHI